MLVNRIVALVVALLLFPAAGFAAEKAIIFPFDLIDQSQQFELGIMPKEIDPEEKRRLGVITAELTKLIKESGRYEVVESAPIAADIEEKSPMYKCNGCEDDLAKKAGASVAFIGTVRKASDVLFTVSVYIRDVARRRWSNRLPARSTATPTPCGCGRCTTSSRSAYSKRTSEPRNDRPPQSFACRRRGDCRRFLARPSLGG